MTWDALVNEAWRPGTSLPRLRELAAGDQAMARIVASRIGLPPELAEELAVQADHNSTRGAAEGTGGGEAALAVVRALAAQPATSPGRLPATGQAGEVSVMVILALPSGSMSTL